MADPSQATHIAKCVLISFAIRHAVLYTCGEPLIIETAIRNESGNLVAKQTPSN